MTVSIPGIGITIVDITSGGGAGVSSLNSLTGALSLTSTGGTVTITPSGSRINLEAAGSGGLAPIAAYSTLSNNTNASAIPIATQQFILGVPGYTASGYDYAQWTTSANNYAQISLQNTAANANASTDYVVTADNGTDSTHYADFGMNSSLGAATPFANANAAYLYSTDNEFDIGALGASGIVNIYTTGGTTTPTRAAFFDANQNLTVLGGTVTAQAAIGSGVGFVLSNTALNGTAFSNVSSVNGTTSFYNIFSVALSTNVLGINATQGTMSIGSGSALAWSSTANALGTLDTGISRASAGVIDFGNGTVGDISARLQAASATLTSTSTTAFVVGQNGTTNPGFQVDTSTASSANGIKITSSNAGSFASIAVISSNAAENLRIDAKGTGVINLGATSTGGIQANRLLTAVLGITVSGGNNSFSPVSSATASTVRFSVTAIADAGLTAATEAPEVYFNLNVNRQHQASTIALQRDFRITGSQHSFTAAGTISSLAALSIDNYAFAGTNATITTASGILIQTQAVTGTVVNAYGINISAPTGATTLNQAALFTGDVGHTSGNIIINTAGNGIQIKSGSNARIGTGTLSGGTLAVANTSVTANTLVFLTDTSTSVTNVGSLTVVTSAGVGFTVTSTSVLDTSTFNYLLVEKN